MKKRGAPFKPDQDKVKSVKPGLRVEAEKWRSITIKYPRKINKMFNDWLDTI